MTRLEKILRILLRCRRGASAVEFAMLLPLFLALVFGIVVFGAYLTMVHGVQQLAAEAARSSVAGLSEKFPEVRTRTISGDIAHESARMDLLVVGSDDAGVVGHAECPVAVLPLDVAASPA